MHLQWHSLHPVQNENTWQMSTYSSHYHTPWIWSLINWIERQVLYTAFPGVLDVDKLQFSHANVSHLHLFTMPAMVSATPLSLSYYRKVFPSMQSLLSHWLQQFFGSHFLRNQTLSQCFCRILSLLLVSMANSLHFYILPFGSEVQESCSPHFSKRRKKWLVSHTHHHVQSSPNMECLYAELYRERNPILKWTSRRYSKEVKNQIIQLNEKEKGGVLIFKSASYEDGLLTFKLHTLQYILE